MAFAAEELRLISALVLLIAIGLFLALPFVLSIGAVVFLPLVTAIVLTIILSPLADRLSQWRLPNPLASFLALSAFLGVVALALTAVLRPAVSLFDDIPSMIEEGTIPERAINDPAAHRAILQELDEVAAGRGQAVPTK